LYTCKIPLPLGDSPIAVNNNNNNNNNETIDHIISACPILAKEQYVKDMIEWVHSYTSTYAR
jgi:hypothetical protein